MTFPGILCTQDSHILRLPSLQRVGKKCYLLSGAWPQMANRCGVAPDPYTFTGGKGYDTSNASSRMHTWVMFYWTVCKRIRPSIPLKRMTEGCMDTLVQGVSAVLFSSTQILFFPTHLWCEKTIVEFGLVSICNTRCTDIVAFNLLHILGLF